MYPLGHITDENVICKVFFLFLGYVMLPCLFGAQLPRSDFALSWPFIFAGKQFFRAKFREWKKSFSGNELI